MYIGVAIQGSIIGLGFVYDDGRLTFPSFFPLDPENNADKIILDVVFNIKTSTFAHCKRRQYLEKSIPSGKKEAAWSLFTGKIVSRETTTRRCPCRGKNNTAHSV